MDPWTWTVDDVINHLCRSQDVWEGRSNPWVDSPIALENTLRDNLIDGATLLTDINGITLKDDLGFVALRERSALIFVVERLRNQSNKYISHQQDIHNRKLRISSSNLLSTSTPATPRSTSYDFSGPNFIVPPTSQILPSSLLQDSTLDEPRARSGEVLVDGPKGKKRKFVLVAQQSEEDVEPDPPRNRAEPTNKSLSEFGILELFSDLSGHAYLGKLGLSVDEVLYGEKNIGDTIDEYELPDNDYFTFLRPDQKAEGRCRFVYNAVTRSMRARTRRLGKQLIIYPYPERLAKEGNSVSATLFDLTSTHRVDATLDSQEPNGDYQAGSSSWDYLTAKWEVTSDDGIRPYAESAAEVSMTDSDPELDDEEDRKVKAKGRLTIEEIQNTISDAIEAFRQRWRENKLPTLERKALSIWRTRKHVRDRARAELDSFETRLAKFRMKIMTDEWKSTKQLRKQCDSLEMSIFEIEELKFKISLWQQSQPPSRLPRALRTAPRTVAVMESHSDEGEGENVDSEPDEDAWLDNDEDQEEAPAISRRDDAMHVHENLSKEGFDDVESNDMAMPDIDEQNPLIYQENVTECIDLTGITSDEEPGPVEPSPFDATREDILEWSWSDLEKHGDRRRLILKLLQTIDSSTAKDVVQRAAHMGKASFLSDDLRLGFNAMMYGRSSGMGDVTLKKCINQARVYLCWAVIDHTLWDGDVAMDLLEGTVTDMNPKPYHEFMIKIFMKGTGFFHESGEIDSDEDLSRSKKKRKGMAQPTSRGMELQQAAKRRRAIGDIRQFKLESSEHDHDAEKIMVNISKRDDQEPIYMRNKTPSRMKPHQIEGVRFMWRELIVSDEEDNQGCLLAHTMGLGKTMQAITLLVTIAETARSENKKMRHQLPKILRKKPFRALILSPRGLIDNWKEEIAMWQPRDSENFGTWYELSAQIPSFKRDEEISQWHASGGVLLVGYEMFRKYIIPNNRLAEREVDSTAARNAEKLRRFLLDGPRIVIADEAHKMKNVSSAIGTATVQFKTSARVALTGSPLANNLLDYYAMINWVAEDYLGPVGDFKVYYQNVIESGLFADSTREDQRKALKRLQALKQTIEPKVHRADITVLAGSLPPKTEFVIKIPLTQAQTKAYEYFVESMQKAGFESIANTTLFSWLNVLALLCAHPSIFLQKIKERKAASKMTHKAVSKTAGDDTPPTIDAAEDKSRAAFDKIDIDADINKLDLSEEMVQHQHEIFREEAAYIGERSSKLSFKTRIISQIVDKAREIGDRVLIFTHYIPTLDFLTSTLGSKDGIKVLRLDGGVSNDARTEMVKDFNEGKYNVFLISTRAGGLGINLPQANRVILVDFHWNPSWEEQAVGRAYRMGQKKPVFVYHLVTGGTFEEAMHERTIFKRQLAYRVVDKKQPIRTAMKPRDFLFSPREVPQEDVSSYLGKDTIMDGLIGMANVVRSLSTTEVLHKEIDEKLTDEELKEVDQMIESDKIRKKQKNVSGDQQRQALEQQLQILGYTPEMRWTLQRQQPALFTAPNVTVPAEAAVSDEIEDVVDSEEKSRVNVKNMDPLSADVLMQGDHQVDQTGAFDSLPGLIEAAMGAEA